MNKYEVHIFGVMPDCIEIEAESEDKAVAIALEVIIDKLDIQAGPCLEEPCCAGPTEAIPPEANKRRRLQ